MNETERLLSLLRDIQEPAPPEGLPSSIWWLTALIACILLGVVLWFIKSRWQSGNQRQTPIAEHCAIALTEPPEQGRLRLASLLRQQALQDGDTASIKRLTGNPWLEELDQRFNTDWFTKGDGVQFGDALYQNHQAPLSQATCDKVQSLLEDAALT